MRITSGLEDKENLLSGVAVSSFPSASSLFDVQSTQTRGVDRRGREGSAEFVEGVSISLLLISM